MDGTTIPLKSNGYVKQLPPGLRRALAAGRWLPIVGAGISAAAMTEDGRSPQLGHSWRSSSKRIFRAAYTQARLIRSAPMLTHTADLT